MTFKTRQAPGSRASKNERKGNKQHDVTCTLSCVIKSQCLLAQGLRAAGCSKAASRLVSTVFVCTHLRGPHPPPAVKLLSNMTPCKRAALSSVPAPTETVPLKMVRESRQSRHLNAWPSACVSRIARPSARALQSSLDSACAERQHLCRLSWCRRKR